MAGDESVEQAAERELREETHLDPDDAEAVELLGVWSRPGRDPRGWVISVCPLSSRLAPNGQPKRRIFGPSLVRRSQRRPGAGKLDSPRPGAANTSNRATGIARHGSSAQPGLGY